MGVAAIKSNDLTDRQFEHISGMVKELCGINLHQGKRELVKARLAKRLRQLGYTDFDDYIHHLASDDSGGELIQMLDVISTNLTSFFREADHFSCFSDNLKKLSAKGTRRLRVWSAGCSSGEEPYTIAMTIRETLGDLSGWDVRILATDISTRVLATARQGVYPQKRFENVPPQIRGRYFDCIQSRPDRIYQAKPEIRQLIHFARLNLMESWPMRGPFDAIFCRNVMIYFDKPTQEKLVRRYAQLLAPGGNLFIGHSESLTGIQHKLRYVQPTVYTCA